MFCAVRSDTNQTYPLFTTLGASPTNFVIDADDFAQNASYGELLLDHVGSERSPLVSTADPVLVLVPLALQPLRRSTIDSS